MNMKNRNTQYVDDDYESIGTLFRLRTPMLVVGLLLGFGISIIVSNFEQVLEENVHVALFLPFIVYIASAIGAQTSAIYARGLKYNGAKFSKYLYKESVLGIVYGVLFGLCSGVASYLWIGNNLLSISIVISTFFVILFAPIIALLVTQVFQYLHKDPAASSGPIATVIQDMISVLIYGIVCSMIIL